MARTCRWVVGGLAAAAGGDRVPAPLRVGPLVAVGGLVVVAVVVGVSAVGRPDAPRRGRHAARLGGLGLERRDQYRLRILRLVCVCV